MARITSQKAAEAVGNRFDLILIASVRARELKRGHRSKVTTSNGPNVTALREIEEGHIGVDYLRRVFVKQDKKKPGERSW